MRFKFCLSLYNDTIYVGASINRDIGDDLSFYYSAWRGVAWLAVA